MWITWILFLEFLKIFLTYTVTDFFLSYSSITRELEVNSAALPFPKRLQSRSLHAERIPLLKISTIFQKNFASTQTSLKWSIFIIWNRTETYRTNVNVHCNVVFAVLSLFLLTDVPRVFGRTTYVAIVRSVKRLLAKSEPELRGRSKITSHKFWQILDTSLLLSRTDTSSVPLILILKGVTSFLNGPLTFTWLQSDWKYEFLIFQKNFNNVILMFQNNIRTGITAAWYLSK